jgi:transitional endoplasmic reticulum ATPase
MMTLFSKNDIIDAKYEVLFTIHQTTYGVSYRVKSLIDGKLYMLKIYVKEKLKSNHFLNDGSLKEANLHSKIDHKNISKFIELKEYNHFDKDLIYYVVNFISGETLKERIDRDSTPSLVTALSIIEKISLAVDDLINNKQIYHGDISPLNIMLDYANGINPILFDFGIAMKTEGDLIEFNATSPTMFFIASEQLQKKEVSERSEIYSLGAVLYYMLTGIYPWSEYLTITNSGLNIDELVTSRTKTLKFPAHCNVTNALVNTIIKATLPEPSLRFKTIKEFINSLKEGTDQGSSSSKSGRRDPANLRVTGEGFKKIAGMDKLKEDIKFEVIDPLLNPESSIEYGIQIPNAVLFFGPPGCGKTFFAERLAEEVGFNFIKIAPSDVASTYIHGTQEKIKEYFKMARDNAPTIIFLDEVDAMMPNRKGNLQSHSYESEVNEWLVQMNNCGDDQIFIIGATNLISKIDPAALRAGRFDRKIYVSLPDIELREELFNLELSKRESVLEYDIDYKMLSEKTDKFSCADISLICMDAARFAYRNKSKISNKILIDIIENSSPSVSEDDLEIYKKEKESEKRNLIGFNR